MLILSACAPQVADPDTPVSHGNEIGGYVELVDALRSVGAVVEPTGTIEQDFFPVEGQIIDVNGQRVEVYDFEEVDARQEFSEQISKDGSQFSTNNNPTVVDWVDQPNFWAQDRLLVLYVGQDRETIDLLTKTLGNPITEHAVVSPPDPPYAVVAAEEMLSEALVIPVDEINYIAYERTEWPDACLGFAEEGEMCAEVLTPGWKIILEAGSKNYEFHADQNGENLRWQPLDEMGAAGDIRDPQPVNLEDWKITLDVAPVLASGFRQKLIDAQPQDENTPYWEILPEYIQIDLENYVQGDTFHEARVYIYPVSGLELNNKTAAEQVSQLRTILEQRPLLEQYLSDTGSMLPFLPLFNARQMIQSQMEYWAFESGMGVRYLTQFSQAEVAVNNHELIYTFQGLSNDGDFYIAAILPVSHPDLPTDGSALPNGDWEMYLNQMEQQIDTYAASSFQPDLSVLDQLIASLKIEQ
jgi:hypothetical protein